MAVAAEIGIIGGQGIAEAGEDYTCLQCLYNKLYQIDSKSLSERQFDCALSTSYVNFCGPVLCVVGVFVDLQSTLDHKGFIYLKFIHSVFGIDRINALLW